MVISDTSTRLASPAEENLRKSILDSYYEQYLKNVSNIEIDKAPVLCRDSNKDSRLTTRLLNNRHKALNYCSQRCADAKLSLRDHANTIEELDSQIKEDLSNRILGHDLASQARSIDPGFASKLTELAQAMINGKSVNVDWKLAQFTDEDRSHMDQFLSQDNEAARGFFKALVVRSTADHSDWDTRNPLKSVGTDIRSKLGDLRKSRRSGISRNDQDTDRRSVILGNVESFTSNEVKEIIRGRRDGKFLVGDPRSWRSLTTYVSNLEPRSPAGQTTKDPAAVDSTNPSTNSSAPAETDTDAPVSLGPLGAMLSAIIQQLNSQTSSQVVKDPDGTPQPATPELEKPISSKPEQTTGPSIPRSGRTDCELVVHRDGESRRFRAPW